MDSKQNVIGDKVPPSSNNIKKGLAALGDLCDILDLEAGNAVDISQVTQIANKHGVPVGKLTDTLNDLAEQGMLQHEQVKREERKPRDY